MDKLGEKTGVKIWEGKIEKKKTERKGLDCKIGFC